MSVCHAKSAPYLDRTRRGAAHMYGVLRICTACCAYVRRAAHMYGVLRICTACCAYVRRAAHMYGVLCATRSACRQSVHAIKQIQKRDKNPLDGAQSASNALPMRTLPTNVPHAPESRQSRVSARSQRRRRTVQYGRRRCAAFERADVTYTARLSSAVRGRHTISGCERPTPQICIACAQHRRQVGSDAHCAQRDKFATWPLRRRCVN